MNTPIIDFFNFYIEYNNYDYNKKYKAQNSDEMMSDHTYYLLNYP